MLIPRKDGTLVYFPVERAVTINPEMVTQETTLDNGAVIRMHLHFGEKVLVRDPELVRQAHEEVARMDAALTPAGSTSKP